MTGPALASGWLVALRLGAFDARPPSPAVWEQPLPTQNVRFTPGLLERVTFGDPPLANRSEQDLYDLVTPQQRGTGARTYFTVVTVGQRVLVADELRRRHARDAATPALETTS